MKGNRILIIGLCAAYAQSANALVPADIDPFDALGDKTPQELYDIIAVGSEGYRKGEYPPAIEIYCDELALALDVQGIDAGAFWISQGKKPFTHLQVQAARKLVTDGAMIRKGIEYAQRLAVRESETPPSNKDQEEPEKQAPAEPKKPIVVETEKDPAVSAPVEPEKKETTTKKGK